MTYEWGTLPELGYKQRIADTTQIKTGDLIFIELIRQATTPQISEIELAEKIKAEYEKEGQLVTYVKVEKWIHGWPFQYTDYKVKVLVYIRHASPLTGIEITLIVLAVCAALGITLIVLAPILWKWAGISPEQVEEYLGALTKPIAVTGVAVIVVFGLFLLLLSGVWKR